MLHLRIGCVILAATILGAAYQDKKDDDKTPKTKPQLPTHYKKLGLRDDQLSKVYKTRTDFRAKSDDLKRQLEKLKSDEREALEKLLTPEQLKRLRELQTGEKSEKPKPGDK